MVSMLTHGYPPWFGGSRQQGNDIPRSGQNPAQISFKKVRAVLSRVGGWYAQKVFNAFFLYFIFRTNNHQNAELSDRTDMDGFSKATTNVPIENRPRGGP